MLWVMGYATKTVCKDSKDKEIGKHDKYVHRLIAIKEIKKMKG